MKKIKSKCTKVFIRVLDLLGITSLFTACGIAWIPNPFLPPVVAMYGMPANIREADGIVYGDIDGDGEVEPVKGIKYTISDLGVEEITNEQGFFCFSKRTDLNNITITFEDIDGKENGSFKTKAVSLDFSESQNQSINVTLENKDE